MTKFNNEAYEALVNDLINDAFYLEGASRRGTIAKIRQYAEVIVRRILNLPKKTKVTLGDERIISKIKEKDNPLLLNSIKTINKMGSKCTHTQFTREITEEEVKTVIDSLFNLYAYLLIAYFEKYEFGTNLGVVHQFSILPPIIRHITLEYLYSKYPENLMIIDKLSLVLLKALNKEAAIKWIEERKEKLMLTPSVTKSEEKDIVEKAGEELARIIITTAPNMYDLCTERINLVADIINKNGKLYNDFESAIDYYRESGAINGESSDIIEFNSIMEFLYLGRKSNSELN
ncbi:hypothetical protein Ana3638_23660 [Anaerocolumna sedimenticola]|uniref:DUF4145 domain-containing protein n=1 Tax=Anaerocolumna sedimenticola TaxID=2696063 RepID=A0A6P1TTW1_9FIRM|nr:hypothetical protein [Anaerocolumna sedimenticola]QHQ63401.1 hypothetical protein Ana3638_23660 [Anaerocolumna sedimenticola]